MASEDGDPPGPGTADSRRERPFVNHLQLTLSLSEVSFDLSQLGAASQPPPVWRFATTPDHLLTMQQGFAVAVDIYRTRYGDIHGVDADPATIRFADGYAGG
jgi:hypothetical protein